MWDSGTSTIRKLCDRTLMALLGASKAWLSKLRRNLEERGAYVPQHGMVAVAQHRPKAYLSVMESIHEFILPLVESDPVYMVFRCGDASSRGKRGLWLQY